MAEVACVVDCRDRLGESPVWCPIDRRLYWLDIKGRTISRFTPETGAHRQVPVDEQPGSLVLREQGGMVVAFYGGFRFFDPETGAVETVHEVEAEAKPDAGDDAGDNTGADSGTDESAAESADAGAVMDRLDRMQAQLDALSGRAAKDGDDG